MPERDDVAFGYDPRPFNEGLKKTLGSLDGLTKKVGNVAGQIVGKLLFVGAAIKGAQALWHRFIAGAPEIGKVFSLASDIFFKNFFWPIRRTLMPLLQSFLDWVRDNRVTFVRWGQTIANALIAAIGVAKALISVFRTIVESLGPRFKAVFGQTFTDFLNLLIAKIAVVAVWVSKIIERLIVGLGPHIPKIVEGLFDIASALLKIAWSALQGLLDAILRHGPELARSVGDLAAAFGALFGEITPGGFDAIRGVFDFLGSTVMMTAQTVLELISKAVWAIVFAIRALKGEKVDWSELVPKGPVFDLIFDSFNKMIQWATDEWQKPGLVGKAKVIGAGAGALMTGGLATALAPAAATVLPQLGAAASALDQSLKVDKVVIEVTPPAGGDPKAQGAAAADGFYERMQQLQLMKGR